MALTLERLAELRKIPIMELRREELVDAQEITIDPTQSRSRRVASFLEQTKNPFAQKVGDYILQVGYMEGTNDTLDERMVLLAKKQAAVL